MRNRTPASIVNQIHRTAELTFPSLAAATAITMVMLLDSRQNVMMLATMMLGQK